MSLTVGDGFKFGCGVILAAGLAAALVLMLGALAALISAAVGGPLPRLG